MVTAAEPAISDADIWQLWPSFYHGLLVLLALSLSQFLPHLSLSGIHVAAPVPYLVTAKVHQTPSIELHKTSLEHIVSEEGRH